MPVPQLPPCLPQRGGPIPPGMRDDGPPHRGLLCFDTYGGRLCRYRADVGHSDHVPYVEGEYLAPIDPEVQP